MRRALLLAVLALPALTACGSTTTTTVTRSSSVPSTTSLSSTSTTPTTTSLTSSSTTAGGAVYFQGVAGAPKQRPGTLELTGDGTLFVQGVQWTSWGADVATGSGNAVYHGCDPTCAQAPVHSALVAVKLFGVRVCSGRRYYSALTLTLNSGQLLFRQFLQRSWSPC